MEETRVHGTTLRRPLSGEPLPVPGPKEGSGGELGCAVSAVTVGAARAGLVGRRSPEREILPASIARPNARAPLKKYA